MVATRAIRSGAMPLANTRVTRRGVNSIALVMLFPVVMFALILPGVACQSVCNKRQAECEGTCTDCDSNECAKICKAGCVADWNTCTMQCSSPSSPEQPELGVPETGPIETGMH